MHVGVQLLTASEGAAGELDEVDGAEERHLDGRVEVATGVDAEALS